MQFRIDVCESCSWNTLICICWFQNSPLHCHYSTLFLPDVFLSLFLKSKSDLSSPFKRPVALTFSLLWWKQCCSYCGGDAAALNNSNSGLVQSSTQYAVWVFSSCKPARPAEPFLWPHAMPVIYFLLPLVTQRVTGRHANCGGTHYTITTAKTKDSW